MLPALLIAALVGLGTPPLPAAAAPPFQTLFYSNEGLRLQAYLFKPDGAGPFPLVVYNHGSRGADARSERPVQYIAGVLVPLGYADGVPRAASDRGLVQLGGRRHVVAGTVCMDQFVVDVGDAQVEAGDEVVLFGPGDDGEPTAQDWAEAVGTITYEIVTRLGGRLTRRHVDDERTAR